MSAEAAYKKVFGRPESLKEAFTHYCPGCGHSVAHRLVATWWRRPTAGHSPWQPELKGSGLKAS